jgi:hypothetical protein
MLKFEITLEDSETSQILKFEDLKDFWKWTNKHYIKEIKTLKGGN